METEHDWRTCPVHWVGDPKPEYEDLIFKEIEALGLSPADAEQLVTHTITMTDEDEGPGIHVWWDDKKDALMAEFKPHMKWVQVDLTGIVRKPELHD